MPQKKDTYYIALYKLLYRLLSLMPWRILEAVGYVGAALLYSLVGYRRRVVGENLRRSFPEKSELEIREIEWQFYMHLVFQFLSAPKIISQPAPIIREQHLSFIGLESISEDAQRGKKAVILLMGHCGNWEALSAANVYLDDMGLEVEQLYRPQRNQALDEVQRQLREYHGAILTPKGEAGRSLVKHLRREGSKPRITAFIADQTPGKAHIALWTTFLNQPTPWLDGGERLARRFDLPVYYADIRPLSNRHFEVRFIALSRGAGETAPGEITKAFAKHLEETIRRTPWSWLWSHRRWKYQPEPTDVIA